jgi:hypothetical protein
MTPKQTTHSYINAAIAALDAMKAHIDAHRVSHTVNPATASDDAWLELHRSIANATDNVEAQETADQIAFEIGAGPVADFDGGAFDFATSRGINGGLRI